MRGKGVTLSLFLWVLFLVLTPWSPGWHTPSHQCGTLVSPAHAYTEQAQAKGVPKGARGRQTLGRVLQLQLELGKSFAASLMTGTPSNPNITQQEISKGHRPPLKRHHPTTTLLSSLKPTLSLIQLKIMGLLSKATRITAHNPPPADSSLPRQPTQSVILAANKRGIPSSLGAGNNDNNKNTNANNTHKGVLYAQEYTLEENLRISQVRKIILNPLDEYWHHPNRLRFSCVDNKQGFEAFQSLPLCPSFTPCPGLLSSKTGPDNEDLQEGSRLFPRGAIEACSLGFSDGDSYFRRSPPKNCKSWHGMTERERLHALEPYLGRNGLGDRDVATSHYLLDNPEAGCAHRLDFAPQVPVAFAVFKMRNVYVSGEAVVFNKSFTFWRYGCQDGVHRALPMRFKAGEWRVRRVGEVMNMAYRQGNNFYHTIVESLPLFLSMAPIMARNSSLPVLALRRQFPLYKPLLEPLVGIPLERLVRYEMESNEIVHADTIYQPLYQDCGRLSRALWTEMRRRHLLHPDGIPLLNPDWSERPHAPLTEREMKQIPEDWVVVVARRPGGERTIVQGKALVEAIERLFGAERVVVFHGDLDILSARNLFRRAKLFVAGHGAALANMMFMPSGARVLEIRPNRYKVICYHSLAEACSLEYHLVFGEGGKHEKLFVDVEKVVSTIKEMFKELNHTLR